MLVVGEDELSCALGQQLLGEALPDWSLSGPPINTRGVTKLVSAIPRYVQQARYVQPVLCVADTDQKCPVTLMREWMPAVVADDFFLRLAVSEAESWVLADREGAANFFGLAMNQIPLQPEELVDPKREVLRLARRSTVRRIREELVSQTDMNKKGTGYNSHICAFVRNEWRASRGLDRSPSLARAFRRLAEFGALQS